MNNAVLACAQCGTFYKTDALSCKETAVCPGFNCTDVLIELETEGAIWALRLEKCGYHLNKFHIGTELDRDCYILLVFRDHYSLPPYPNGFDVFAKGNEDSPPPSVISIGIDYSLKEYKSIMQLSLDLTRDKLLLYEWFTKIIIGQAGLHE